MGIRKSEEFREVYVSGTRHPDMKSRQLPSLFISACLIGGPTLSQAQTDQLPEAAQAVFASVDSWEIDNREAVLASIGESSRMMRGEWVGEETVGFGSELAAFDAIALPTGIELSWVTTSEFGSEVFAVERKQQDGRFATITMVKAEGVSNRLKVYRFLDLKHDGAPQTYRLRQVDQNGTNHVSRPLEIFPFTDQMAVLRPEITGNAIQLPLESRIVKVTVWNSDGELILSMESWEEGIQEINTGDWEAGRYAIQMETDSGRRSAMIALP